MNLRRFLLLVLPGILLLPAAGWAEKMREPKVDYSADTAMEMESHSMKGKIYYTPGKQRQEMGGAEGMTTILRRDKQVVWMLMGDMYMEMPLDQSEDPMEGMDVQQTVLGEEVVNGVKTTKSKVIGTMKDGRKFGGFFWTTKDDIAVKMDLLMKEGEKKDRIVMELTNLKVGKQDPKLFEPPPGAMKNDMGAMMGFGRGKRGRSDQPERGNRPNIEEMMKGMRGGEGEGDQGPGSGMDINKMMKDMMGR